MMLDIECDLINIKDHFSMVAFGRDIGSCSIYNEVIGFNDAYDSLRKKIEELSSLCKEQRENIECLQERVDFLEMDEKKKNARANLKENLDELPFPDESKEDICSKPLVSSTAEMQRILNL